jgi:hypothetical protein
MRYLPRIPLPPRVLSALGNYQDDLDVVVEAELKKNPPESAERIESFWKGKRSTKPLKAVERALRAMASGLERCMYCEDSRGCDIEHSYPKVRYHSKAFLWLNLLLICADCNRQKNDAFDEGILDPTKEDPLDHIVLSFTTGRYTARDDSPRGTVTLRIVRRVASDQILTQGRQRAVATIRIFLRDFDACQTQGRLEDADQVRRALVNEPFSAAFAAILRASKEPGATDVLGEALVDVVSRHPAMHQWLKEADDARTEAALPELAALARAVRIPGGLT